jgi:hypothetical protein
MIAADILYLRVRVIRSVGAEGGEAERLEKRVNNWREETARWLEKHDRNAYARFINDGGLVLVQGQLGNTTADRLIAQLDIRLARLLDIASK